MLAGIAIASVTAVAGVLVYAIHSMIVMTALYLAAGLIGRMSGSNDLREVGGLYAASPMFAGGFLVLAFSVSGLPPTSGFWGKFILVKASLEVGAWWLAGGHSCIRIADQHCHLPDLDIRFLAWRSARYARWCRSMENRYSR